MTVTAPELVADEVYMDRALAAAARGLGRTSPNPAVGAVLVRDGAVLGEGTTQPLGQPHAEPMAIRSAVAAGHDPRGATLYVTLEPCCHHGRTPPCTDAVIASGITRVVIGTIDPYPAVRGGGVELLRRAGVQVDVGIREQACKRSILGFARAHTTGLPEVTAKVATSLDGRIATATGESKWITGEAARAHAHRLRGQHDAILVGSGTVLADDPRLTCRIDGLPHPVPVVLDSQLRIAEHATVFLHPKRPIVICAEDAPDRALPAHVERIPRGPGGLDLQAALRVVVRHGLHRVLVEGGAKIHRSLLDAGLIDTLLVYVAPKLIPGGIPWLSGPPLGALSAAPTLTLGDVERLGDELALRYSVRPEEG